MSKLNAISIYEIGNVAFRCALRSGLDPDKIFKHRYGRGQTDWGYTVDGDTIAWFGSPYDNQVEIDDLEIFAEWDVVDFSD